jgi:hypothetical protein
METRDEDCVADVSDEDVRIIYWYLACEIPDKLTCDSSSRKSHGLRLNSRIISAFMIAVPYAAISFGDSLDNILACLISSCGVQSPDMFPIDLAVERVLVTSIRIAAGQVVGVRVIVCVIVIVSFGLARHRGYDL